MQDTVITVLKYAGAAVGGIIIDRGWRWFRGRKPAAAAAPAEQAA